jgi:hypothetical protein
MPTYIHQLPDWPNFTWDDKALAALLAKVRNRQGRLVGRMEALGFPLRSEAVLQTLTQDVVKSSEIEGEILDTDKVRSSIAFLPEFGLAKDVGERLFRSVKCPIETLETKVAAGAPATRWPNTPMHEYVIRRAILTPGSNLEAD